ncbi:F-box/WD repeat-containing protein 7, partial [Fragariocoptes setiger]
MSGSVNSDPCLNPPPPKRARKSNPNPEELQRWLRMFSRWSPSTRIEALESIISSQKLDMDHLRQLQDSIDHRLRVDFISYLPRELALYILSFLEPKDLLNASQVSRYWRVICEDNLLWRQKCKEEGLLNDRETFNSLFSKRVHKNMIVHPALPALTPFDFITPKASHLLRQREYVEPQHEPCDESFRRSNFKLAYLKQASINHNWRTRIFKVQPSTGIIANSSSSNASPDTPHMIQLRCHEEYVITCLQFNPKSNIIVSGSDDMTLRVWDAESGQCLRKLEGHSGGVWSSQLSPDDIVISGSTDRTIKVWNAITGQLLSTLCGHSSTVRCMSLNKNRVVSGSRDHTLRLWDIDEGVCIRIFVGHNDAVRCVEYNGELIVSGAYDHLVKVWEATSGCCLHSLASHENRIYSLQFDGQIIASGSLDTSICIWDAKTGTLKHKLRGHTSLTSKMQLKGKTLVSANADSHCKVWNIETGECLLTLNGHTSAITSVHFNNKFVVTSSDDGTVKLWDVKTGQFIRNLIVLPTATKGGVVWRIRASNSRLVCAVGNRSGAEDTQLLVLSFDDPFTPDYTPTI